jgi:hypothetical protein
MLDEAERAVQSIGETCSRQTAEKRFLGLASGAGSLAAH